MQAVFRLFLRNALPDRGRAEEARFAALSRAGCAGRARRRAGSSRSGRRRRVRGAPALENHTLKRALTDPRLFSGIGNAYSDEILHRARLSPLRLTRQLDFGGGRCGCTRPRSRRCSSGPRGCARRRATNSRRGDRVPARDDGARAVRQALPGVRDPGAAHHLRREERGQLLPALPDRRAAARGPVAFTAIEGDWPRTIEELEEMKRGARG